MQLQLADLLSLLSVSESHAWAEVRLPLLEEALDRKVLLTLALS